MDYAARSCREFNEQGLKDLAVMYGLNFWRVNKKGVFTLFSFHSILHLAVSFFNLKPIL